MYTWKVFVAFGWGIFMNIWRRGCYVADILPTSCAWPWYHDWLAGRVGKVVSSASGFNAMQQHTHTHTKEYLFTVFYPRESSLSIVVWLPFVVFSNSRFGRFCFGFWWPGGVSRKFVVCFLICALLCQLFCVSFTPAHFPASVSVPQEFVVYYIACVYIWDFRKLFNFSCLSL